MLHDAKHGEGDQLAAGQRPVDQFGGGVGYGMGRLRGACPVVVIDELPGHTPNVCGVEEDEIVECILTKRALKSFDVRIRIRGMVGRRKLCLVVIRYGSVIADFSRPLGLRL